VSTAAASWRPVAAPLCFAAAALLLSRFITDRPEEIDAMARGIAGPTTWPTVMLYAVVVFALAWAVQRAAQVLRRREGLGAAPASAPEVAGGLRVWVGIALVLVYGFSLAWLGFALGTVLYIVLWLLLGGIRSPRLIAAVSLVGTVAMLYLFIKLALMPLDRGAGVIGEFSVWLYRLLGIY
jgi:putative tricarboxylic transport membrane protein